MQLALPLLKLIGIDLLIVGLLLLAIAPLAKFKRATYAVLKRNFYSYFSTPTGYVFLCVFVFLTGLAAFWPHEFFNSNMATLQQLNQWLPYIMLVFIPTITMSIWADERRQGTDELLLTIPADDFDIVLGKYLASAAIFTVSLLFSQLSNFSVLNALAGGGVDIGLYLSNYIGYWMVGLAMLALGMVASFLTSNLTVGFILGVLFNAPLALASEADVIIPWTNVAQEVSQWSLSAQFEDFGRGIVSTSSIVYFGMIIVLGLYVSMVLIGRRHWLGGRDGHSMLGHYVARILALVVIAVGVSMFFTQKDVLRADVTSGQIASLSDAAVDQIADVDLKRPVHIEAFISRTVPEEYVQTKYDLISLLREVRARGGDDFVVNIRDEMEPFSEEAKQAEEQYGIRPTMVPAFAHGSFAQEEIFMGVAITSGLERVIIPFLGPGTPVEYELIRSIRTVAEAIEGDGAQGRKTLGLLRTDAQLRGGFDFQNFTQSPQQPIVDELAKQYDVEDVDPSSPIEVGKYDVLLVVQPSSLTPPQMDNLIEAVRKGQPTALFEDPLPTILSAPGTDMPKQPQGGMMMGQPPEPKGNIQQLWDLLGIRMVRGKQGMIGDSAQLGSSGAIQVTWSPFTAIIWQSYNPYPKIRDLPMTVLFANPNAPGAENAFQDEEPAVAGLSEVAFIAPGAFVELPQKSGPARQLKFIPLVRTGDATGIMTPQEAQSPDSPVAAFVKPMRVDESDRPEVTPPTMDMVPDGRADTNEEYVLAARIRTPREDESDQASGDKSKEGQIDVIVVSDIDVMGAFFLQARERPNTELDFHFQNVPFVLNTIDVLAGDLRFVEIRKRQVNHASLQLIESRIFQAEQQAREEVENFQQEIAEINEKVERERRENEAKLTAELNQLQQQGQLDERAVRDLNRKIRWLQERNRAQEEADRERSRRRLEAKIREINRELDLDRLKIQNEYKLWAVVLPPVLPLAIAVAVFVGRRLREREGVSKARLRVK